MTQEEEVSRWCKLLENRPFSSHENFCFGCDEGRKGKTITRTVKIEGIDKEYEEIVCKGCGTTLNILRKLMPPIIQVMSHEGVIVWRIPKIVNQGFKRINGHDIGKKSDYGSDEFTDVFEFSDGGYEPEDLITNLIRFKGDYDWEYGYHNGIKIVSTNEHDYTGPEPRKANLDELFWKRK